MTPITVEIRVDLAGTELDEAALAQLATASGDAAQPTAGSADAAQLVDVSGGSAQPAAGSGDAAQPVDVSGGSAQPAAGSAVAASLDSEASRSARSLEGARELGYALRSARALDGALVLGDAAIYDELFSAVQRLCFEAAVALLAPDAVVDYRYFSSASDARLAASGDRVTLSGTDLDETSFPRLPLIHALVACGSRWLALLDQLGRTAEADHLRPFAHAARAALAGS